MRVELFDVQCGFGGMTPGVAALVGVNDLVAEMARLQIAAALVHAAPEDRTGEVPASNAMLYTVHAERPELTPCPVVVPSRGSELPPEAEQVDTHLRHGSGAVFIRPSVDCWSLAPWVCDQLFGALQERRVPVLSLERMVNLDQIGELAGRFPSLPIIVAGVHYRQDRLLLPLLEAFPRVYLSIGNNYTVHRGIEQYVASVGPERLLFGTGFPDAEPMTAITQLMYADISDDDRQLIGAVNLERLISEIAR